MDEKELSDLIDSLLKRDDVKKMLDKEARMENMFLGMCLKVNRFLSPTITLGIIKKKLGP
jgi:hypothetical protein